MPYNVWSMPLPLPHLDLVTSFPADSPWGEAVNEAMVRAERDYVRHLLDELDRNRVSGDIVEFGVFDGVWLSHLAACRDLLTVPRSVWGFDSFEGLPAPRPDDDLDCWHQGQYAADYDDVARRLQVHDRPWLFLEKGWFNEAFTRPHVQAVRSIAFARIDCDLYQPAVECLDYLTDRLSDGAVLVFDDWTYDPAKGETKAFLEWKAAHPAIETDFLLANSRGHLYFRVRRA